MLGVERPLVPVVEDLLQLLPIARPGPEFRRGIGGLVITVVAGPVEESHEEDDHQPQGDANAYGVEATARWGGDSRPRPGVASLAGLVQRRSYQHLATARAPGQLARLL